MNQYLEKATAQLNEAFLILENAKSKLKEVESLLTSIKIPPAEATTPKKLNKKAVIYLNAGHGDFKDGVNYTFKTDGKYYHFLDPKGSIIESAYEGHWNRVYADLLGKKLVSLGFEVVKTYHPTLDATNVERAKIANSHYLSNNKPLSCWFSIHFNAMGMLDRGIGVKENGSSIWTLVGQNESDVIANSVWSEFKKATQATGIRYLEDKKDGDPDYEAHYQEFNLTSMPAVIHEILFFNNWEDFQKIKDKNFIDTVTTAHAEGLFNYFSNVNR